MIVVNFEAEIQYQELGVKKLSLTDFCQKTI